MLHGILAHCRHESSAKNQGFLTLIFLTKMLTGPNSALNVAIIPSYESFHHLKVETIWTLILIQAEDAGTAKSPA